DAAAAAATLAAYAVGLFPFVLARSVSATFLARGDTATPVKALFAAVAVNVACKIALMGPLAQVGLALATAIGGWVNLALLVALAARAGLIRRDARLNTSAVGIAAAGLALAAALWAAERVLGAWLAGLPAQAEATLVALVVVGAAVYFGVAILLLGRGWFAALRGRTAGPAAVPPLDGD
ncbi:MAG TPA: lipid II flippase MurJ, partial [Xanthobacteraceae bacterium]